MFDTKLNPAESISIILTIFVAHTLVLIPRNLLVSTKSAIIINLIYVGMIVLALTVLIVKLFKKFPRMWHNRYCWISRWIHIQKNFRYNLHFLFYIQQLYTIKKFLWMLKSCILSDDKFSVHYPNFCYNYIFCK